MKVPYMEGLQFEPQMDTANPGEQVISQEQLQQIKKMAEE